jgi:hypothetical protein
MLNSLERLYRRQLRTSMMSIGSIRIHRESGVIAA